MEQTIISDAFINRIDLANINKIEKSYVHKENEDYVLISEINEIPHEYLKEGTFPNSSRHKYLYSVALPKYDCSFCFDHELDHLPFIMVIELIRQVGIGTAHAIHDIPISGYSNIMDNINVNMFKFLEIDIPLIMIVEDVIVKKQKTRQEREMHFYLFQNETLCANIDINALVMEKDLYLRLRTTSRGGMIKDTRLSKDPSTNLKMLGGTI